MSVISELRIEYNRNFTKAVIALAREDFVTARSYLDRAAKALNEIAVRRTGYIKECTENWVFDIVKEIGNLDRAINNERTKDKVKKMLADRGRLKSEDTSGRFACRQVPDTTFNDIAGLEDVKEAVMYKAVYPRRYPELYDTFRKRSGGGILLYGLPGTGKTLIAEAIAHETGATFFPVRCSDLGSKWFGETEQNIRDVFEEAREAENAVIFFDEIEAYASNRRENSAMERSVPEFLAQMQGVGASGERNRILVIGATNKPWRLDGAFLRPGRFDEKIYVPLPAGQARMRIMQLRLQGIPDRDLDLQSFVQRTEGFNGADVDYLCEKAKEYAIKRILNGEREEHYICNKDFEDAFSAMHGSVLAEDRTEMEKWVRENVA
ncbi:MAG: AAA family ATPase [Candidatus Coproplasma sp.]